MNRWTRWVGAALPVIAVVLGLSTPAAAAVDSVTLEVDPAAVTFGKPVELSGVTDPATPGQTIEIVDAEDPATVLADDTTGASGGYSVEIPAPPDNVRLQAVWVETGVTSDPVLLRVRPVLFAKLTKPRLFDIVKVRGSITPPQPGDTVIVTLFHAGKFEGKRTVPLKDGGRTFQAKFLVEEIGTYRARVRFDDDDHLPDTDWTTKRWARVPPNLHTGSHGIWVKLLERRLRSFDYHLPGANKDYNHKTADAVLAFHKVQRMNRISKVTGKTWKRLQHPIQPDPRNRKRPFHIEVDQTRQVLYVIRKGEIDEIVHTSTGAGGATRDGVFYVHRKIAGYSPNRLYYPSYFDGQRAVHGWPEVPSYPASHGCARVPYWTAIWLHNIMPYGTQVRVYHS